jgi:hypothetical protein
MWRRVTAAGAVVSVLIATPLFLASNLPSWPTWAWLDAWAGHPVNLFDVLHLRPLADWMAGLYGMNLADPALGYVNADGLLTRLPVQVKYPLYLVPTLFALAAVSLLTRQHNQRAVDEFYCRLDTPVGEEHKIRDAGFQVDQLEQLDERDPDIEKQDARSGGRLLVADLLRLPRLLKTGEARWSDYKWDWIGIGASVAFVIMFLWGVEALGRLF